MGIIIFLCILSFLSCGLINYNKVALTVKKHVVDKLKDTFL